MSRITSPSRIDKGNRLILLPILLIGAFFISQISLNNNLIHQIAAPSYADSDHSQELLSFTNFSCPNPPEQFFTTAGLPAMTYQYDLSETNRCEYKNAQQAHYLIIYFWKDYSLLDARTKINIGMCQKNPCLADLTIKEHPAVVANISYNTNPALTTISIGGKKEDKGVIELRYDYGYSNNENNFLDKQLKVLAEKMIS